MKGMDAKSAQKKIEKLKENTEAEDKNIDKLNSNKESISDLRSSIEGLDDTTKEALEGEISNAETENEKEISKSEKNFEKNSKEIEEISQETEENLEKVSDANKEINNVLKAVKDTGLDLSKIGEVANEKLKDWKEEALNAENLQKMMNAVRDKYSN